MLVSVPLSANDLTPFDDFKRVWVNGWLVQRISNTLERDSHVTGGSEHDLWGCATTEGRAQALSFGSRGSACPKACIAGCQDRQTRARLGPILLVLAKVRYI